MTSPVHTGKFFMLEGVIVSKGEVFILAVSFDRQALFDFTMKLGQSEVTDFDAFRITEQGDILVTELPKATHPTPPKAV